jgi:hypothetical protein
MTAKKKSGLGTNPLAVETSSKGIFQKTEEIPENGNQIPENGNQENHRTIEALAHPKSPKAKSRQITKMEFLAEDQDLDKVTLRISIELNDWLDNLLKQGKRNHGQKIAKEVWVQAALELFKAMPVDWTEIQSVEQMRERLHFLESSFHKPEN